MTTNDTDNRFGSILALNGDATSTAATLVIGAWGFNSNQGKVYKYEYNNSAWAQISSQEGPTDGGSQPYFGKSLSLNKTGFVCAVGAKGHNLNSGQDGLVQVYNIKNSTWTQIDSNIYGGNYTVDGNPNYTVNNLGYIVKINNVGDIVASTAETTNFYPSSSEYSRTSVFYYNGNFSTVGDPHVTTIKGKNYDLDVIGIRRLIDNCNSTERFLINVLIDQVTFQNGQEINILEKFISDTKNIQL